jgi:hypothetical protein
MRSKWFRRVKRFIELFTPGGTEYTESGMEIHYSHTGATSIPESEHEKILFRRLEEFKKAGPRLDAGTGHRDPN